MSPKPPRPPGYLTGPMAARAKAMRAQFEDIRRRHKGESGRRREDDVAEFLRAFLPGRLGVAHGEIAATDGSQSGELDLIVYDAIETPLLEKSKSSVVVPVEGVYGVIEVASKLDRTKLQEDVAKIRAVKRMTKTAYWSTDIELLFSHSLHGRTYDRFPVLGFCFGYESVSAENLLTAVMELDGDDPAMNIDMVCSLSAGCVANGTRAKAEDGGDIATDWRGAPDSSSVRFAVALDPDAQPGRALLWFYLLGCGLMAQGRTAPLRMAGYGEIGA